MYRMLSVFSGCVTCVTTEQSEDNSHPQQQVLEAIRAWENEPVNNEDRTPVAKVLRNIIKSPDMPGPLKINDSNISSLPEKLPVSITSIELIDCKNLTRIPELPAELYSLAIYNSPLLNKIPCLPDSLSVLIINCCNGITELPELPAAMHALSLDTLPGLKKLDATLPDSLTLLEVVNCKNLKQIFSAFPGRLVTLNLSECSALESVSKLPESVEALSIKQCSALSSLPGYGLPELRNKINTRGCHSLPIHIRGFLSTNQWDQLIANRSMDFRELSSIMRQWKEIDISNVCCPVSLEIPERALLVVNSTGNQGAVCSLFDARIFCNLLDYMAGNLSHPLTREQLRPEHIIDLTRMMNLTSLSFEPDSDNFILTR